MSLKNKLSYSQINKYMFCPTAWKFHYKDKIREHKIHSALLFGTAIDEAVQVLLRTGSLSEAKGKFYASWSTQVVGEELTSLSTSPKLVYANSDFDPDLLKEEDWAELTRTHDLIDANETLKRIYAEKDYIGWDHLPEDRKKVLNHANWLSLKVKGECMLSAFYTKVMLPNFEEVLSIQEETSLKNDQGDEVAGFVDFVVKYRGYSKPIILDLKTSARDYEKDSVVTSPQLSLYLHSLSEKYDNTRYAGYIVLKKQMVKNKEKICTVCDHNGSGASHKTCPSTSNGARCGGEWRITIRPEATVQILIDSIPDRTEHIVLENFDMINTSIKNEVFHRNFSSCVDPKRGRCPYYNLCYHQKMDGLFCKEKKE